MNLGHYMCQCENNYLVLQELCSSAMFMRYSMVKVNQDSKHTIGCIIQLEHHFVYLNYFRTCLIWNRKKEVGSA